MGELFDALQQFAMAEFIWGRLLAAKSQDAARFERGFLDIVETGKTLTSRSRF